MKIISTLILPGKMEVALGSHPIGEKQIYLVGVLLAGIPSEKKETESKSEAIAYYKDLCAKKLEVLG